MPFHPSVVHVPIVISLILPIFIGFFLFAFKKQKAQTFVWGLVVFLQAVVCVSGYVALESGEIEEDRVEKVIEKKWIHAHEEAAEIFVGFSVISFCIGFVSFFLTKKFQMKLMAITLVLSFFSAALGINVGRRGGDLVYKHGAGKAFISELTPEE